MTTKTKKIVIARPLANAQTEPDRVNGFHFTPKGNIVLEFAEAEVIMPANWRPQRELCVGDCVSAYWDDDARFHLTFAD